jgi:hypothetical protein
MHMKKPGLVMFFVGCMVYAASAQTEERKDSYPSWTISKDVQRLQFRQVAYVPATITTGSAVPVVSKGVQQISVRKAARPSVRITTTGTPSWVISKGVARMQYERE